MRRLIFILCMLVNVSVMLLPFSTSHAHVVHHGLAEAQGVHEHVPRAGHADATHTHTHGFDLAELFDMTQPGEEQIVDLDTAVANKANLWSAAWGDWLPLACVVVLLVFGAGRHLFIVRPPESTLQPFSRNDYWRPPLRGPPISISAH